MYFLNIMASVCLSVSVQRLIRLLRCKTIAISLCANREEHIQHLTSAFSIEQIKLHKNEVSVLTRKEIISAEMHPNNYFMDHRSSYPRDFLVFLLPFSGDQQLLKVRFS